MSTGKRFKKEKREAFDQRATALLLLASSGSV